ncbi:MAG: hypothetical protein KDA75_10095 [Planctomycetaceae bacterium]|nr:hypothetical protein [Planctomycetaceae bacterium]
MTRLAHLLATMACAAAVMQFATAVEGADYFNGFEVDTAGWDVFGGSFDAARVPTGTGGISSAEGDWHATGNTPATDWDGYGSVFPAGGYLTSVDVFLNVDGGFANDTRLDYTSAISTTAGNHLRDFVFNLGFYSASDLTGPGAGTNRFIISASNSAGRANSFPKNPGRSPISIDQTGWYTFEHMFRDNGIGILEVELSIFDSSGTAVGTWTLSSLTDVIGVTVGGNRYGWFATNEFGVSLAFDNTMKVSDTDGDGVSDSLDDCPESDFREFVDVGAGPTSIENAAIGVDTNGCTLQDYVNACEANAGSHGEYVSCITQLANVLQQDGVISKSQRQELKTGAARSDVGK